MTSPSRKRWVARWKETRRVTSAMRRRLVERFPLAFMPVGEEKKPLKVGIHTDIATAAADLDMTAVRLAIKDYTSGPKYLRNVIAGADRLDLDGAPAGAVTAEHAFWSAGNLKKFDLP